MPIYVYRCGACGTETQEPRSVANRDTDAVCKCGQPAARDKIGGMTAHTDTGYQNELLSDALGVHPSQIAEAQAKFPHHRFAPDGRMRIGSHQERKRVMRDLGYHDNAGYY